MRISSGSGNAMGLALHELATNAVKYGALGAPKGRVTIAWRVTPRDAEDADDAESDQLLHLRWIEANGLMPVEKPTTTGFGTRLIDRLIKTQGGSVIRDWRPTGFAIDLTLPMPLEQRASASEEHLA